MSTVQSILDGAGYVIDDTADAKLYALINLAIRAIAKRLYLMRSDMIVGDLSVAVYAADTVSADDISFTDADPDTIDSAAEDLSVFNAGSYLAVTGDSDNNGTYQIASAVTATITLETVDELSDEVAGDDVVLTSIADYADLPADFWGLVADRESGRAAIYLSGDTRLLTASPGVSNEIQHTSAGRPLWFRVKNTKIHIYPPTSTDITLVGPYFQRPTAITATSDTMPFGEIFDDAIIQTLLKWYSGPLDMGAMGALQTYLWLEVDKMIGARDRKGPQQFPDGVDWDLI